MNTKKLQSCLNFFSVIKFVKGLQITIMDNPTPKVFKLFLGH